MTVPFLFCYFVLKSFLDVQAEEGNAIVYPAVNPSMLRFIFVRTYFHAFSPLVKEFVVNRANTRGVIVVLHAHDDIQLA